MLDIKSFCCFQKDFFLILPIQFNPSNEMSGLKSTYKILPEYNLIIEIHKGTLDVESYIKFKKRLSKDPEFRPNMNNFINHNMDVFSTTPADVQKFVDFIDDNTSDLGRRKVAMLTTTPNQVVTTTIYKNLLSRIHQNVEIFSTSKAALNWLIKKPNTTKLENIISKLEQNI